MAPPTAAEILAAFPHPVLSPIGKGFRPTFKSVTTAIRDLESNAEAIRHPLVEHGYLGLLLTATAFAKLSSDPFPIPTRPPRNPEIPEKSTVATIDSIRADHALATSDFESHTTVEDVLRKQITDAVDEEYIMMVANARGNFVGISVKTIIDHLRAQYAEPDSGERARNLNLLADPWTTPDNVEHYFTRLRRIQRFAADNDSTITNSALVDAVLEAIGNSGLLTEACKAWVRLPSDGKTFAALSKHMVDENKLRIRYETSTGQRTLRPTFANLAVSQPATARPAPPRSQRPPATTAPGPPTAAQRRHMHWCWTHGFHRNANHNSESCERPGPGHQRAATADDMQGGNPNLYAYIRT